MTLRMRNNDRKTVAPPYSSYDLICNQFGIILERISRQSCVFV